MADKKINEGNSFARKHHELMVSIHFKVPLIFKSELKRSYKDSDFKTFREYLISILEKGVS